MKQNKTNFTHIKKSNKRGACFVYFDTSWLLFYCLDMAFNYMWVSFSLGVFGHQLSGNESKRSRNSEQLLDGGEPAERNVQESVSERQLISWS